MMWRYLIDGKCWTRERHRHPSTIHRSNKNRDGVQKNNEKQYLGLKNPIVMSYSYDSIADDLVHFENLMVSLLC